MDFPSREEARVYMMLQTRNLGEAPFPPPPEPTYEAEPSRPAAPAPPAAPKPAPPPAKLAASPLVQKPAPKPAAPPPPADRQEQSYVIQKAGFEGDTFDRRGIRTLIRTGALNPADQLMVDGKPAGRADQLQDLKSLFELRKSAKFSPPAVCPKHLDQLAHYVCAGTRRPLCEECAEVRKFGGTSVRVCVHCAGTVEEIPVANE